MEDLIKNNEKDLEHAKDHYQLIEEKSNDYINTTESADAVNRNTFISKTDIL